MLGRLGTHYQLLLLPSDRLGDGSAEMDSPFTSLLPQPPRMP